MRKNRPSNPLIIGYTTRDHLLLDLDDTTLKAAASLVRKVMEAYPEVGDALILLSSPHELHIKYTYYRRYPKIHVTRESYHVVFNGRIGYNKCCRICETLSTLGVLEASYMWCRKFRGDMTLRISSSDLSTGLKPAPVAVCGIKNKRGRGDGDGISQYLSVCRGLSRARL